MKEYDEVDEVIARLEKTDREAASYLKATDRELSGERERTYTLELENERLRKELELLKTIK